jgi:hypothetical protein
MGGMGDMGGFHSFAVAAGLRRAVSHVADAGARGNAPSSYINAKLLAARGMDNPISIDTKKQELIAAARIAAPMITLSTETGLYRI